MPKPHPVRMVEILDTKPLSSGRSAGRWQAHALLLAEQHLPHCVMPRGGLKFQGAPQLREAQGASNI